MEKRRSIIVTIKMPDTMVGELKLIARKKHFVDLSEEIRSIIRQKWISLNPEGLVQMQKTEEKKIHTTKIITSKKKRI